MVDGQNGIRISAQMTVLNSGGFAITLLRPLVVLIVLDLIMYITRLIYFGVITLYFILC